MPLKKVVQTDRERDPYFDVKRSLIGPAVYYVLREPLLREQFLRASAILASQAESVTGASPDLHWKHLQQRLTGEQPAWDVLVPYFDGPVLTPEDGAKRRAGQHSVTNIAAVRGYSLYRLDGLDCTFDYFNPANELGLLHSTVGETVLALVLRGGPGASDTSLRDFRNDLHSANSFFAALKALDAVLTPEWVVGSHSLGSVVLAYLEGRINEDVRPWEFFHPLSVLPVPDGRSLAELQGDIPWLVAGPRANVPEGTFRFGRVDEWPAGRALVLAERGFSAGLVWEIQAGAALFGRVNVHRTLEFVNTFHRDEHGRVAFQRHRRRMDKPRQASPSGQAPSRS